MSNALTIKIQAKLLSRKKQFKTTEITKNPKIIRRALVGGVLFGGAGAIVGAISGNAKTVEDTKVSHDTTILSEGSIELYDDGILFVNSIGRALIPITRINSINTNNFNILLDCDFMPETTSENGLPDFVNLFIREECCFAGEKIDMKAFRKGAIAMKKSQVTEYAEKAKKLRADGVGIFNIKAEMSHKFPALSAWKKLSISKI